MSNLESDQVIMRGDQKRLNQYIWKYACPTSYVDMIFRIILACCFAFASPVHAQEVIVNPTVIQQDISGNTLRAIFGMRLRTWDDGSPITVFVLTTNHPTHVKFTKDALGVFSYQLERAWDRLVFSGTGQAPTEVFSEKEMLTKVAATPGSIGYIKDERINDRVRSLEIH